MLSTNALQVLQHTEMQMWYLQEKVHAITGAEKFEENE